jgi:hypothetical protein
MINVLKEQADLWPIKPDNVIGLQVCNDTGVVMNKNPDGSQNCPSRFEYFIKGTEGKQISSPTKMQIPVTKDSDKQASSPTDPNVEMTEKTVMKDPWSTYCLDCAHDPTPGH